MRSRRISAIPRGQGELALIRRIRRHVTEGAAKGVTLGIGDDCALLTLRPGEEAAVTTDLSIEGRHFKLNLHPPEAIGYRSLARGLSDVAAMGARPVAAFLSLGVPSNLTRSGSSRASSWIDCFFDGFLSLARKHKTPLAGGDLAQSPFALADIVLIGAVPRGKALLRSGARPGDVIYVTGSLGGSAFGLRRLCSKRSEPGDLSAHLWPQPRIPQGLWLRRRNVAAAAIDISDGLSTDLRHLCDESKVAAEIDAGTLPIFPGANLEDALHGGEDYELLFTARAGARIPRSIAGVPVTRIGSITKARRGGFAVTLTDSSGVKRALHPRGWEHFRVAKPE